MIELEAFYRVSPIPIQHAATCAYGAWVQHQRFGGGYGEILSSALARSCWSGDQILEYQSQRVRKLIRHCYDNVPYYRRQMRGLGLTPLDFRSATDLKRLPILTKDVIRDQGPTFRARGQEARDVMHVHTSGTTGAGLKFIIDRRAHQEQWAIWWRYRMSHGISPGTWCAYWGGRTVVPVDQQAPPFWRVNLAGRQVLYSSYHMSQDTIPSYISDLQRRKLPWIHGYPSSLALLARYVLDRRARLKFRLATIGAENLLAWQKRLIEQAFGCRCLQHYGSVEGVANFSECEAGNLHADEDFCAIELVPTQAPGEFSIVGTSLGNYAMPFVRYETGDVCGEPLSGCGCGKPGLVVSQIDGRKEDYVILRNRRRLGRLDHIFKDAANVREAQIVQSFPGEILVYLVPARCWTSHDAEDLLEEFKKRTGPYLDVKIEYRERLERTASGKLRFVISKCPEGKLEPAGEEAGATEKS